MDSTTFIAHAAFFVEDAPAPDLGALLEPGPLLAITLGVMVALTIWAIASTCADPRRPRCAMRMLSDLVSGPLSTLTCIVPVVARMALGATMLWCAVIGSIATPNLGVQVAGLDWLRIAAAAVGTLLLVGIHTRTAALAAALTFVAAAAAAGMPIVALERLDIIGLAAFVAIVGGRRLDHRIDAASLARLARGTTVLRCTIAVALLTVAITEKLANAPMTALVLEQHPRMNPGLLLGIDPITTVLLLGAVEVAFAVLVLLLPLPEIFALALGAPFVLTVGEFGLLEVPGHLPVWGAVAVLALLGAHLQTADLVSVRPPWMRDRVRTPYAARERIVGARVPWVEPQPASSAVAAVAAVAAQPPLPSVLVGSSTGQAAPTSQRVATPAAIPSPPPIAEPIAAWLSSAPAPPVAPATTPAAPAITPAAPRFEWAPREGAGHAVGA